MANITHRCNQRHGRRDIPCTAFRTDDGFLHRTCGEPCSWVMGKGGHGEPPYAGREEFEPSASNKDNVEQYMHKHGINNLEVKEK